MDDNNIVINIIMFKTYSLCHITTDNAQENYKGANTRTKIMFIENVFKLHM